MTNTEIQEIQKRPGVDGVELPAAQKEFYKKIQNKISYDIDRNNKWNAKFGMGEATLLININQDQFNSLKNSIRGLDIMLDFERGAVRLYTGQEAKDFATILAKNGIDFKGIDLLKENNLGGARTI